MDEFVKKTWDKINKKMLAVAPRSKDKLPYITVNGVFDNYYPDRPSWWTNGFWGGLMWLMYADTKNELYKEVALRSEELLDAALKDYDQLHHDVGFMWHITSGVNYRLTGNKDARIKALNMANLLAARYNINGKYIRAWNSFGTEDNTGWSIIDSMMNIPLLYWASDEVKDERYRSIAISHADTVMKVHVRDDGSVRHIVENDIVEGGLVDDFGGQGYDKGSSWSRGQAWAIYGFVLSYIHTCKQEYLDTAKKVAHYFISCVCDEWVPKCDFRCPKEPVYYDTSAGAIAACGLIEIANLVGEFEKDLYLNAALKILKATEERFCDWSLDTDNILTHATEAYHADRHHISMIYADYYFVEAIYKLRGNKELFW